MPSSKSRQRNRHKIRALCLLAISVVGLVFVAIDAYTQNSPVIWALVIGLGGTLLPDRIAEVMASFMDDQEEAEDLDERAEMLELMRGHFGSLSTRLLAAHDIVAFPTRIEGLEHCIYLSKHASHIKNTALRYKSQSSLGNPHELDDIDKVYLDWVAAKKLMLKRGQNVTEIISKYFSASDPVRRFAEEEKSEHYRYHCIDDVANPMVQVTIFEFEGRRSAEIVMGWEIPGKEEGLSFASRHADIVEYFSAYFSHNLKITEQVTWEDMGPKDGPPESGNAGTGQAISGGSSGTTRRDSASGHGGNLATWVSRLQQWFLRKDN